MEDRTKYIGGSDVGAILGLNKWRTPLDVFYEKTGLRENEDCDNEFMYWGREIEPLITKKFMEQTTISVKSHPIKYQEKYPFLAAHVDGVIESKNDGVITDILECKCASEYVKSSWGEEGSADIPASYLMQVAHYSNIFKVEFVYIAVLFGGNDFKIYQYIKDEKLEKQIEEKLVDFWENNVLKREPPMPVSIDEAKSLYRHAEEGSISVADNEILDVYYDMMEAKKLKKESEKAYDDKELKIMNFMNDAETLVDNSGATLCTWKNQSSDRFQQKEFKSIYPDVYSKFLKENKTRRFLSKGIK